MVAKINRIDLTSSRIKVSSVAAGAKDQIRKVLEAARFLSERFPQLSATIRSVEFKEDYECRIAYIQGNTICFNPIKFIPLSQPDVRGIILHELGHAFFKSIPNINPEIPDISIEVMNVASDIYINDRLRGHYAVIKSEYISENALFPETYGFPRERSYAYYLGMVIDFYIKQNK